MSRGEVWRGAVTQVSIGEVRDGKVRIGVVRQVRRGMEAHGGVRYGRYG